MGFEDRPNNFPRRGATWMLDNIDWLREYTIRDILCMPGSHNAGMDRLVSKTSHVTEDNVKCQTGSVGEQLRCGVRWFDIRPFLKGSEWYCGHFTNAGAVGWQGGLGEKIDDVIADVNGFTANNKELVVLRLSHVADSSNGRGLNSDEDTTILRMFLNGLNNIRKSNTEIENVLDQKLDKYVGSDQCVIVATRITNTNDGPLIKDAAWDRLGRKITDYEPQLQSLCYMQDSTDAIMAGAVVSVLKYALLPLTGAFLGRIDECKILNATNTLQEKCFPTQPQVLTVLTGGKSLTTQGVVLQVDNNRDDAAMTMCLAASRAQWMTKKFGEQGSMCVAVYGGQLITDKGIIDDLRRRIAARKKFKIENSLFQGLDNFVGSRKSCCIYYSEVRNSNTGDGLFWKGRFAREGDEIDFASDIDEIFWHNAYLKDLKFRQAYCYFIAGLVGRVPIRIDVNMPFLQPDPAVGTRKHVELDYWSLNCVVHKERNIYEGRTYDFWRDIDWIRWDFWIVDDANVYRQFFDRIDGESTAGIEVKNDVFGGKDPAVGKRKEARISLRRGPGTDREDSQMEGKWWNIANIL